MLYTRWTWLHPVWLVKAIRSWLEEGSYVVRVGDRILILHVARESLPQGPPLFTILFKIFVEDIPTFERDPNLHLFQFADGTALVVRGINVDQAKNRLDRTRN